MATILSIDASSIGCSVALLNEEKVLAFVENPESKSAATYLTTYIKQVCDESATEFSNIDAVAVAKGPGSYTGLRVAVSTAKGFAMAINKPLISYDTLDAIAFQNKNTDATYICPMLDARRAEVYCKFFETKTMNVVSETEAVIVENKSFKELLDKDNCLFVGEGSEKCRELINHPNAIFSSEIIGTQSWHAKDIIFSKFNTNTFEDLVTFEPFYLKEYMFKVKGVSRL
jgi:tRNA threonylcarbamoyladenosine biosynthesis protein TsaB